MTRPSNPLNTLNTRIRAAVPIMIADMLIQEITLIALVVFFALKYRQAKRKCKLQFYRLVIAINTLSCR